MTGSDEGQTEKGSRFETDDGVEVVVHGAARGSLACRILDDRDAIHAMALRLMGEFLSPTFLENRDAFDLVSIEVFARQTSEDGDFLLRFFFDADRREFGNTYLDVSFRCHPPPNEAVRPFRFTVGFH